MIHTEFEDEIYVCDPKTIRYVAGAESTKQDWLEAMEQITKLKDDYCQKFLETENED